MNNSERDRSTWTARLMLFLHWLVRVDPDILTGCPTIDRFHFISKAVLLSAVAGIALFAWGAFFFGFWPVYIAGPLTLVTIVWIVLIDQFMGAARWTLQGVLSVPGKARRLNGAVILRLAIGLVTASATSFSANMAINHATIAAQQQKDRDAENAAKRKAAEEEKARLWEAMLGADDAAVKQASAEEGGVKKELDAVRQARENADRQLTDNKLKADCQLNGGPGCRKGVGPQFRAALIQQAAASGALNRASGDLAGLETRLTDATNTHDDAVKTFRAREPDYLKAAAAIDARVAREEVPERNDPVMSFMALQEVYASPMGPAARFYSHLMLGLLLTVELSYVLVSEYFGHATIYMARLIARTKILAAEAAEHYRQSTGQLFTHNGRNEGPVFRLLPRFKKPEEGGEDGKDTDGLE
jgi:hypothetical protein